MFLVCGFLVIFCYVSSLTTPSLKLFFSICWSVIHVWLMNKISGDGQSSYVFPLTYISFFDRYALFIGFPFLSGSFLKMNPWASLRFLSPYAFYAFLLVLVCSFISNIYSVRLLLLVFYDKLCIKNNPANAHESSWLWAFLSIFRIC